jgi:hypothetical protein
VGEEAVALQRRRRGPRVHRERQPTGHLDRHLARSLVSSRVPARPSPASDPIHGLDGLAPRSPQFCNLCLWCVCLV